MRLTALTPQRRALLERLLERDLPVGADGGPTRVTRLDRTHGPLSHAQQRIWFFDRLQPGSPLYLISGAARLRGALDVRRLQRCLTELVERHESLRTTFHSDGGPPWSRVDPAVTVALSTVDLRGSGEDLARRLRIAARQPFDLTTGPLLRARLFALADHEHVLLLSMHHIAADGWSLSVLVRELGERYAADAAGDPGRPEPLPVQYLDFAVWQHDRLAGPALRPQLDYWREQLDGAPVTDLPTDRPRPAVSTFAGATMPVRLDADLMARVRALADEERATPYMVLVAALATLFGRWSGASDVVLAAPVANRTRVELEGLIGFFVNTLALRLDLSGRPSFRGVLRRARETCLAAYAHQDAPFDWVIERLRPERDGTAHTPVVRHMLVLHNTPREALGVAGLSMELMPLDTGTAKFDLQVELTPAEDGALAGQVEYSTELFEAPTVRRLVDSWQVLLGAAVARPDRAIAELALLDRAERDRVLSLSGRGVPPIASGGLGDALQAGLAPSADLPAVRAGGIALTYRALHAEADRLARHLRARGVRRGDVVGICLPRGIDALVAHVAVVKADAAYLPLDPSLPIDRLTSMLEGVPVAAVVTRARGFSGRWVVDLDRDGEAIAAQPARPPQRRVTAEDAVYVMYTSGSTGTPKAAVNPHGALVNRVRWMQRAYPLGPGEAVLHKTPLGFDVSGWEWMWPLMVGATVIVAEGDGHRDPAYLAELMRREQVTTCHFVPSMLREFLAHPAAVGATSLRRIICSGEELSPATVRLAQEVLPGVELHNLYGPTEAAIDVTAWAVPPMPAGSLEARVAIGRPLPGAELYVLDADGELVPGGVAGELHIGGCPLARGYHGRPGLTADWFRPDPFTPGARLYRTGDRVRWSNAGDLEYLGRLDRQVKVNGQRVEPAEVEAAMAVSPGVDRVLVTDFRDNAGHTRLAAYVSLRPDAEAGRSDTSGHIGRWREVFDDTYAAEGADPDFDTAGWVSSYTGAAIPEREMRVWVDETAARIDSLGARRILEIGCGTGLLLGRIAPRVDGYTATDISATALRRAARVAGGAGGTTLLQRPADDFSGLHPGTFDAVVLNSVVQYFPDEEYLRHVLESALALLPDGGRLFVGDVRSLPLLRALHCSLLLHRLPAGTPRAALVTRLDERVAGEEELVVHPRWFRDLARLRGATVALAAKASPHRNELTRFRYDVVFTAGATAAPPVEWVDVEWVDRRPGADVAALTRRLAATDHTVAVGLSGVPDARLRSDLTALAMVDASSMAGDAAVPMDGEPTPWRTVGDLRRALAGPDAVGATEPAAMAAVAARHGRGLVALLHPGAPGHLDLVLAPAGRTANIADYPAPDASPGEDEAPADGRLTNEPARAAQLRGITAQLRADCATRLPAYAVPAVVLAVRHWPMTRNGKVDRAALPTPETLGNRSAGDYVAPRTTLEREIAEIWSQVLGLDRVGVNDDFFALGGHSLLATQLVARLYDRYARDLPLGRVFQAPTVAAVARWLEDSGPAPAGSAPAAIGRAPRRPLTRPGDPGEHHG